MQFIIMLDEFVLYNNFLFEHQHYSKDFNILIFVLIYTPEL